jgi:hypothetical protein
MHVCVCEYTNYLYTVNIDINIRVWMMYLAVEVVEAACDIPCELEVLPLILSYRNQVRLPTNHANHANQPCQQQHDNNVMS